ncbi:MAG: hypothetical protein R3D51_17875 [Hyphomicrobiaceae bacterium]
MQNNPLSCPCASDAHPHPRATDPSGFFLKGLFKAIGSVFRGIGRVFAHAAKAIARSSIGRAILQIVACANPAAAFTCAPAAAGLTLLAGGTLKQAFISAALAFVQVGASNGGIIDIWGKVGDAVVLSGTGPVGTALSHGVVSGAISMAQGGSFVSGFMSGAVAGGVGEISGGLGEAGQFTATVVAGGTASILAGGKFANGAITAAFALMYNKWAHPSKNLITPEQALENRETLKSVAWALIPGSDVYDCFSAQCSGWGWAAAAAGVMPGPGKALGKISEAIAAGHAFTKHILAFGEFRGLGIRTRKQFADHIESVMRNPTASKSLSGGRSAYWDDASSTVIIHNPRASDGGTAFQPIDGRK